MSIFGTSLTDPSDAYYEGLEKEVEYQGQQFLEEKQAEIEQLEQQKMASVSTTGMSKTPFIVLGIAGIVLIAIVVIKKGYFKKGKK